MLIRTWDDRFEWDSAKDAENRKKHGVPFRKILRIFDDPYFIEAYDYLHSTAEDRYIDIGSLEGIVEILVVFTFRGHRTRLISARTATQKEKNLYNEHLKETI